MNFVSLFAGIGGIDLGLERAGMRCVAQVEINPFCRRVLAKHWPDVPRFEDVRTFNRESINDRVDLIAGGFPCQDISMAGDRAGIQPGTRSGLWSEMFRLVCEFRPQFVAVENVAGLLIPDERWGAPIGVVLSDLASVGFDAEWESLPASALGAFHQRDRVFVLAYREGTVSGVFSESRRQWESQFQSRGLAGHLACQDAWAVGARFEGEPDVARLVDGVPESMGRNGAGKAYGNAVHPQVAEWIGHRITSSVAAAAEREAA